MSIVHYQPCQAAEVIGSHTTVTVIVIVMVIAVIVNKGMKQAEKQDNYWAATEKLMQTKIDHQTT